MIISEEFIIPFLLIMTTAFFGSFFFGSILYIIKGTPAELKKYKEE